MLNKEHAKYINLESVRERLRKGREIKAVDSLIDSQKLINDFKEGKALQGFADKVKNTKIDVVSLA